MIAIIESGSSKSDWVILNKNKEEVFRSETIGFNPHFIDQKSINNELNRSKQLVDNKELISQIYFYGAGCSSTASKNIIKEGLASFFQKATHILVDHDLLSAAYAAYFHEPAIVCILGTGSNSCFFDGKKSREEIPSLGYVLGDYGSGNHLGKQLLSAFAENKLDKELKNELEKEYQLTIESIIENVYKKPFPNKYLAAFSPFIHKNRDNPYIQKIIYDSIEKFFEVHVMSYPEALKVKINFIGSVAHYYQDTIRDIASKMNLTIGHIVSKPIDRLVDYHTKYIL